MEASIIWLSFHASSPGFAAQPMIVVTDGTRFSLRASASVVLRGCPFLASTVYFGAPSRVYQCELSLARTVIVMQFPLISRALLVIH